MKQQLYRFCHLLGLLVLFLSVVPQISQAQTSRIFNRGGNGNIIACFSQNGSNPITGEVLIKGYENCVDILSASYSVSNPGAVNGGGGGGGAGKALLGPFQVTKLLDKASPTIFLNAVLGTHIQSADFYFLSNSQGGSPTVVAKITLENILISSVSASFYDTSNPSENVTFEYQKICIHVGANNSCFDAGSQST